MEYFDKSLLDNDSIEKIVEILNYFNYILNENSLLPKYREFYKQAGEELLNYYNQRYPQEIEKLPKDINGDELPF